MRVYQVWVKFWPAPDLRGQWIAHCLDFDVVTQGNSLSHAMSMALEAAWMVASDDHRVGLDPLDRRAPHEFWEELYRDVGKSRPQPLAEISDPSFSGTVYANLTLALQEHQGQERTGVAMVV